jgi:hypothetical protein
MGSIAHIVRFWAAKSPDNVALICDTETVSYGLLPTMGSWRLIASACGPEGMKRVRWAPQACDRWLGHNRKSENGDSQGRLSSSAEVCRI